MEFNEKLHQLRKQKGITQEALAEALYVSRTAVSKWESGRGYPSIDSLKAIAEFFSVTVDELLSPGEVIFIAEQEQKQKERHLRDLVFGLLDVCVALLFFLPFFAHRVDGIVHSFSLLSLVGVQAYLKASYIAIIVGIIVIGILTLALQNCQLRLWLSIKTKASLALSEVAIALFIISSQPYAAFFVFALSLVKTLILIKKH